MGSCFGRCVAKQLDVAVAVDADADGDDSDNARITARSCLWRKQRATDGQEEKLVSNANNKCTKENFIYRIMKFKAKQKRAQFIDQFWEQKDMQYTKLNNRSGAEGPSSDIQLQNLDVHNLLSNANSAKESMLNYCISASSRDSSSLDLEWEHEYGHMRQLHPHQQQQHIHNTYRSTQSLQLSSHSGNNNAIGHHEQYMHSSIATPTHQLHTTNNNNNNNTPSKCRLHSTHLSPYNDNHPLQVHLNDSWQYLRNGDDDHDGDGDQPNSFASYSQMQSQSQSLSYEPLNAAATTLVPLMATRSADRMRWRRTNTAAATQSHQPPTTTTTTTATAISERRNSSFTRTLSSSAQNSWSYISTPESLEWDQDEEQQRQLRVEDDNLDHETLELLHQIEQLKNRVLDETGDGLFDDEEFGGGAGVSDGSAGGGNGGGCGGGGIHFVVGGVLHNMSEERRHIS